MADQVTSAVIEPILKKGVSKLVEVIARIYSYQTFITTLRSDHDRLETRQSDIQRDVNDARSNRRDIKQQVERWLQQTNANLKTTHDFLGSLHSTSSNCNCNCKQRYKAATRAETLSKELKTMLEECRFHGGVSFDPKPPNLAPTLAVGYVTAASREKLLERLKDSSVLVIGVYGPEGAGKTMLAKRLAVEIESSEEFNSVVLTSVKQETEKIQQEIAERVGFTLDLKSLKERARWLHDRLLSMGKVVFIIDDLDTKIDLNEIGIPWPDDSNGCRMVVVSRSSSVCSMMKTQINLEVGPLSQQESLDLLDELAKEYNFASTTCKIQEAKEQITSKEACFPGEIQAYIRAFQNNATKSTVASSGSRDKSFMIAADALQIEHGDKPQHWRMSLNPSTSSMEAKLVEVWFLHIEGKAREECLWPATNYGAYLVYKIMPNARGFKASKVELVVSSSYKSCFLDPEKAASSYEQKVIGESEMPKLREDEWLEIEMGSFYNDGYSNPEVDLLVKDHNTAVAKSGLSIRGIELRPLDRI